MLGNNADAFFTTPMRTTVITGGNAAHARRNEMPAPFVSASATRQTSFIPLGDETQIVADTKKFLGVGVPVVLGLAALAFFMLKRA